MRPANPALAAGWITKRAVLLDQTQNFNTGNVYLDRLLTLAAQGFSTSVSPVSFWASFGLSAGVVVIFLVLFVFLSPKILGCAVRVICCPCKLCSCLSQLQRWAQVFETNFDRLIEPLEQRRELRNARRGIETEHEKVESEIAIKEQRERLGNYTWLSKLDHATQSLNCFPMGWYGREPPVWLGLDARVLLRFAKMIRHIAWAHSLCVMTPLMVLHYGQNKNRTQVTSYDASGTPEKQELAWLAKLTPPPDMPRKWLWVYPALALLMSIIVCFFVFFSYRKVEVVRNIYFDQVAMYDKEAADHEKALQNYRNRRIDLSPRLQVPGDIDDTRKIIAARATKWILVTGFTSDDVSSKTDGSESCCGSRRGNYEQKLIKDVVSMPSLADLPDLIRTQNEDMARFEGLLDTVLGKLAKYSSFDDLNKTIKLRNEERSAWCCCLRGKYRPRIIKETLRLARPERDAVVTEPDETSSFDGVHTRKWHTLGLYLPSLIQMRIMIGQRLQNFVNRQPLKDQSLGHARTLFGTLMQILTCNCCRGSSLFKSCKSRAHVARRGDDALHYAFRQFPSRADANQAVRDLTEPSSIFECFCCVRRKTKIILAPAPEDIIWNNLSMEPWARTLALFGNWFLMIGFTILFIVPNAFSSIFLSDLSNFAIIDENWRPALQAHPKILDAIQGILAPTVQNVFYMYLPGVFRYFRGAAGEPTRSGRERDVFSKLFVFFVFNNLVIFSCFTAFVTLTYRFIAGINSGYFWETTLDIISLIPDALGAGFSHTSTYWLTYMLQRNISAAIELVPVNRMIWFIVAHVPYVAQCFSPTALKSLRNPPTTDYAGTYNSQVFTAIVLFCLTPFQPLIAMPAAIFFLLNYVDLKYNLTRVSTTKYESYGSFWKVAVDWLLVATAIGNFCFGLVVHTLTSASGRPPLKTLELWLFLPSILTLLAFRVYCGIRFETRYYGLKANDPKLRWFRRLIQWYTPRQPPPCEPPQEEGAARDQFKQEEYDKAMTFVVPELFRKKRGLEIRPQRQKDLDAIIRKWQDADVGADLDTNEGARLQGAVGRLLAALRPIPVARAITSKEDDHDLGDAEVEEAYDDYINQLMAGIELPGPARNKFMDALLSDQTKHVLSMQYVLRQELGLGHSYSGKTIRERLVEERDGLLQKVGHGLSRAGSNASSSRSMPKWSRRTPSPPPQS